MHKKSANMRSETARGYLLLLFAPGTFASPFLSKDLKIKISKHDLLFFCYFCRCATWSLTLSEVHTPREFDSRVPRVVWAWEGRSNRRLDSAAYWGNSWSVPLIKHYLGDEITENLMCEEKEMCIQVVGGETWSEGNLEELDIDGKIILTWILNKLNRKGWAVVTVINLLFQNTRRISGLAKQLSVSQEGFCSMELVI